MTTAVATTPDSRPPAAPQSRNSRASVTTQAAATPPATHSDVSTLARVSSSEDAAPSTRRTRTITLTASSPAPRPATSSVDGKSRRGRVHSISSSPSTSHRGAAEPRLGLPPTTRAIRLRAAPPSTTVATVQPVRLRTRPARANTQPPLSAASTNSPAAQRTTENRAVLTTNATTHDVVTPASRGATSARARRARRTGAPHRLRWRRSPGTTRVGGDHSARRPTAAGRTPHRRRGPGPCRPPGCRQGWPGPTPAVRGPPATHRARPSRRVAGLERPPRRRTRRWSPRAGRRPARTRPAGEACSGRRGSRG